MKKKKCKVCPEYFTPRNSLQQVCSPKCSIKYAQIQREKKNQRERKEKLPLLYPVKYKNKLQAEINLLSRKIDAACGYTTCIDCGETLIGIGQVDAAHFANAKNHGNIRFNLHNLHSARSNCNQYSDDHKSGYERGLQKRYGKEYLDRVKRLDLKYKGVSLSPREVNEKLKIVRKINREFEKYHITDAITARDMFNKIIGIYKPLTKKMVWE